MFLLVIELNDTNCNSLDENIKLVFRENNRSSPVEETVDEKIKARISKLPIHLVQASEAILEMMPELMKVKQILDVKTNGCVLAFIPYSGFFPWDSEQNVFCWRGKLMGYHLRSF